MSDSVKTEVVRQSVEERRHWELLALQQWDESNPKPDNWLLSPKAVYHFIIGMDEPLPLRQGEKNSGQPNEILVERKFYGNDILVQRAIASLASNRALLLIGEPGTAKSWLSEHLAAAISRSSHLTIQGTAGTTDDQIKYSWNYALLLAKGPTPEALVPAPLYTGMKQGKIVRFEEITRCPREVQDSIISVLSDKVLAIPELPEPHSLIHAAKGFNLISTANTRDRGVNEMSSALKRRFNFETVPPLDDLSLEMELVTKQTEEFLEYHGIKPFEVNPDVVELLVTTFQDLRFGQSVEGVKVARPSVTMSTAEAVETLQNAAVFSHYMEETNGITPKSLVINMLGTIVKDEEEDLEKLRSYFDVIVRERASATDGNPLWKEYFKARKYFQRY